MWSVDHSNRVVTLRPTANYFSGFIKPPTSIFFEFTGTNSAAYRLRVNVPSVGALGTRDVDRQLSVITPATLVVNSGGFNSDNSGGGAMLLSPRIEVDSTNTPVNIGAYVVTSGTAARHRTPFLKFDAVNTPNTLTHTVTGGLSYTVIAGFPPPIGNFTQVNVIPSVGYLQGTVVPPAVPAVFDYRIAEQDLEVYSMYAVPNP
jgi:hypothetical protein